MLDPAELSISWMSERHLRVSVGSGVSVEMHRRVVAVTTSIFLAGMRGVVDVVPAYDTVVVEFELLGLDAGEVERRVRALLASGRLLEALMDPPPNPLPQGGGARKATRPPPSHHSKHVEIPVCYEGECAPDLGFVAASHGLSAEEVIARHSGAAYFVHFVGFMPGFAYLGGLDSRLETPRLEKPRVRVPAGSVGIGGRQTGVYPRATPGGWRLIGRTPLSMFDPEASRPSRLAIGDRVRFVPISMQRFREIEGRGG